MYTKERTTSFQLKKLQRPKDMGMLIVIGGPGGSGSSTIAKMIARHYGLHYVYGGKFMRDYAEQYGYEHIKDFLKSSKYDQNIEEIDKVVDEKLLRSSQWHDVLIDSKVFAGIATNMQVPCTVKIWLDAKLDKRVRRTLNKQGKIPLNKNLSKYSIVYKDTKKKLKERFETDAERYGDLYDIDYKHPEKYNDIVLDTSALNEGQTLSEIIKRIEGGGYY